MIKSFFISVILMFLLPLLLVAGGRRGTLIEQTCKTTPYYSLCVSTLQSNPKSSTANVAGLALIVVDDIKAKATATLKRIIELNKTTTDSKLKQALVGCASKYNVVLGADMPEAVEALTKGDYKFAEDGTADAANEAGSCGRLLGNESPLSSQNRVVHCLSAVAAAIIRSLL